jgi:hypothetical protein
VLERENDVEQLGQHVEDYAKAKYIASVITEEREATTHPRRRVEANNSPILKKAIVFSQEKNILQVKLEELNFLSHLGSRMYDATVLGFKALSLNVNYRRVWGTTCIC